MPYNYDDDEYTQQARPTSPGYDDPAPSTGEEEPANDYGDAGDDGSFTTDPVDSDKDTVADGDEGFFSNPVENAQDEVDDWVEGGQGTITDPIEDAQEAKENAVEAAQSRVDEIVESQQEAVQAAKNQIDNMVAAAQNQIKSAQNAINQAVAGVNIPDMDDIEVPKLGDLGIDIPDPAKIMAEAGALIDGLTGDKDQGPSVPTGPLAIGAAGLLAWGLIGRLTDAPGPIEALQNV